MIFEEINHSGLESNDLESSVVSLAKHDRKLLNQLVRIAYDRETLVGWASDKGVR